MSLGECARLPPLKAQGRDDKEVNDFTRYKTSQAQIRPVHTPQAQIRNFCIITDHGKSTHAPADCGVAEGESVTSTLDV